MDINYMDGRKVFTGQRLIWQNVRSNNLTRPRLAPEDSEIANCKAGVLAPRSASGSGPVPGQLGRKPY